MKTFAFPYIISSGKIDFVENVIDVELTNKDAKRLEQSAKKEDREFLSEDPTIDYINDHVYAAIIREQTEYYRSDPTEVLDYIMDDYDENTDDGEHKYPEDVSDSQIEEYLDLFNISIKYPKELQHSEVGASKHVAEKSYSQEELLEFVQFDPKYLKQLPEDVVTRKLCSDLIKKGLHVIEFIPEKLFDKSLVLQAIKYEPYAIYDLLNWVPDRLKDYDVCLSAVKRAPSNLKYVPDELKDYQMCCMAAVKNARSTWILDIIPPRFMNEELCLLLVKNGFFRIKELPENLLTSEICLEAVKRDGELLKCFPRNLITQEICNAAMASTVQSIHSIPDEFVTEQMLLTIAEEAIGLLEYNFPERYRTPEFFHKLIEKNPQEKDYIEAFYNDLRLSRITWVFKKNRQRDL